ncbi:MAG TPA: sigma 54-interacting transcriptional regulator, partial [Candidatus Krumholzibacterium sp.]|nr:sigma 54-interacting transcriptional regulator [Candidatus Krumholzibacterium sp.]
GAAGGTFFLDEIGELPMTLQAALLRVIQEKEIRRIGESERRFVDTRFVFATNRDLAGLVGEGRFRQDLYYRIRGVRLTIPPLRERRSDIMVLAHRFLVSAARREGIPAPGISNAGIRHLIAHDWPGNVRELKNEMERVIALYPYVEMVEPRMLSSTLRDNWARRGDSPVRSDRDTLPEAVRKLEQRMITRALERFDSNRTRSAEFLGITRQGLLKKLKRYRLA